MTHAWSLKRATSLRLSPIPTAATAYRFFIKRHERSSDSFGSEFDQYVPGQACPSAPSPPEAWSAARFSAYPSESTFPGSQRRPFCPSSMS